MRSMNNNELDEKIEAYCKLMPGSFPVMYSITLKQEINMLTKIMEQQMRIVLSKDERFSGEMFYLDLFGVRNLRINQPSLSLISLSLVEIAKAPPNGRFDGRFVVLDGEHDCVFSCSCNDFYAIIRS